MKTKATCIVLWAFLLLTVNVFSQAPQKFNYQAIVRDDVGNIVEDQAVSIKISILQGSIGGTVVYSETHSPITNSFGLVTMEIGGGTTSDDITLVDWGSNIYFMKVEMDATGGTTYIEMGISQVLSVPYALHSKTAENIFSGDYLDLSNTPTNVSSFTNDAGYLTSFTESDPVFGLHVSSGILSSDLTNWNNAFGWGDHSGVGYLTSYIETDPVFTVHPSYGITGTNITNWTTAFSWGDHSAEGYLTTEVDGDDTNEIQDLMSVLMKGNDAGGTNITGLAEPINVQDAATKSYVDNELESKVNALVDMLIEADVYLLKDVDGNYYNTTKIGNQIWMAENLKTTKYNDGSDIPLVTYNTDWSNLTSPGYCWWGNDQGLNGDTYGALYNWYVIETGKLCPSGWHVPTDAEWTVLTDYVSSHGWAGVEGSVFSFLSSYLRG